MAKQLLFIFLLSCSVNVIAQNLVANGSFEDRNTCTELRAVCAPEAWFRIPLDAVSGNRGTAGFLLGNHHESMVMENILHPGIFRSYIYTRILCPLEKGREYVFSASFRAGNQHEPFGHVDVLWLDFEPFHFQNRVPLAQERITIRPENKTTEGLIGFKNYSIRFVATGDEKYLLIGNMSKEKFPGKPQQRSLIIYDIDNVSLLPADETFQACPEREVNQQKLYAHNYRHTPGKFLDDEEQQEEGLVITKAAVKKDQDTVLYEVPKINRAAVPQLNDTLVIPDVLFKFDRSELNPVFAERLDTLISKIKNRTFKRMEILGHTDSFGTDEYNQQLSQNRAETVKQYLVNRLQYPAENIITKGFAASMPVSSNTTPAGRQKNRRVEIVLIR